MHGVRRKKWHSWIRGLSLDKAIFEMDVKIVCDAICSNALGIYEFGIIMDCCRSFLFWLLPCCVQFVGQKANETAHVVARAACNFASPSVWSEALSFLLAHVNNFCTFVSKKKNYNLFKYEFWETCCRKIFLC